LVESKAAFEPNGTADAGAGHIDLFVVRKKIPNASRTDPSQSCQRLASLAASLVPWPPGNAAAAAAAAENPRLSERLARNFNSTNPPVIPGMCSTAFLRDALRQTLRACATAEQ
jgi:hypothetical protein